MTARGARRLFRAVAALTVLGVAPAAEATVVSRAERGAGGYWTAERMADARPLDVVRGGSGPALRLAPQPPPFESSRSPTRPLRR